jgi:hypothetical protein
MLFIAAALFVCSHGVCALEWDLPLDIDLIKVHFNHNIDSTASDGITIQKNKTVITSPEYYPAASKYDECAYLMSVTAPTVKAEFFAADWSQQLYSYVTIYADKSGGEGDWELAETNVAFASEPSGQVSFNTNGSYPQASTVGKWSFTWSWYITKINGTPVDTPFVIGTSSHTYYNTYSTPNAPMTVPWVEVLNYSCEWAQGETTVVGAATDVAAGIYNAGNMEYDEEYSAHYTDHEGFDLSGFLYDFQTGNVIVNCYDCSNIFCIFANSLGCTTQTLAGEGPITTRSIQLIGRIYDQSENFASHQFGVIGGNYVYDSSLIIYNMGYIPPGPPPKWYLPYNMELIDYENALIQSDGLDYYDPETTVISN